jgi:dolichol-phosphate mannosyltransferase
MTTPEVKEDTSEQTAYGSAPGSYTGGAESNIQLSLVIPTLNEAGNISALVSRLDRILFDALDTQYEIIVIDDDSPDGTWQIAQNLQSTFPKLSVYRRSVKNGLGSAVVEGWQLSSGKILATINADFQHPPETLSELIAKIIAGADLAVATRHSAGGSINGWSLKRKFFSRVAHMAGIIILPTVVARVSDPMSGYFAFRRECIAAVKLKPIGFKTLIEVLARGNVRTIAEVGYTFRERQHGKSKASLLHSWQYIKQLLKLRKDLKSNVLLRANKHETGSQSESTTATAKKQTAARTSVSIQR